MQVAAAAVAGSLPAVAQRPRKNYVLLFAVLALGTWFTLHLMIEGRAPIAPLSFEFDPAESNDTAAMYAPPPVQPVAAPTNPHVAAMQAAESRLDGELPLIVDKVAKTQRTKGKKGAAQGMLRQVHDNSFACNAICDDFSWLQAQARHEPNGRPSAWMLERRRALLDDLKAGNCGSCS